MTDFLDRETDYDDPRVASAFDELSFWSARFGLLLFQHLHLERNIDVLDVGCGTGFPLFELAGVHGRSCRFTGVDVWPAALSRARRKRRVYGLDHVRLIRADAARLPLPDTSFDLIVSNLGLNNFAEPEKVLAECARVARPHARLVLTTNPRGHMQEFYDLYREVLEDLGLTARLAALEAAEARRGTEESVSALLEAAGFRVSRTVRDRFYLRYADGAALLRHPLTRFGFLDGWRAALEPADERPVFEALEARLNELAHRKGELQLTVPALYVEGRRR